MNRFALVALSAIFFVTPAAAADKSKYNIGAGYGLANGGVLSLHADADISNTANAPVKARIGYDHYSLDYNNFGGKYSWSYNIFYGGAYYDLNRDLKLDKKVHPFVGLGLGFGTASCSGSWCNWASSPTVGGLYFIGGLQYNIAPTIDAEVNLNGWGGLTVGANFKF